MIKKVWGIIGIAYILGIISVSTNDWSVLKKGTIKQSRGLWKECLNISKTCKPLLPNKNINFPEGALKSVRICALLSLLLLLISLIDMKWKPKEIHLQFFLILLSGLFAAIALIIWIVKLNEIGGSKAQLGYSFYLMVIVSLLSFASAFIIYKTKLRI